MRARSCSLGSATGPSGLILAHQDLEQLRGAPEVAAAALTNTHTRICFRLGDDRDARRLEGGFSSFDAQDLQNLGIGEAIARLGQAQHDFNLKIARPQEVSPEQARARREAVIGRSQEQFGTAPRIESPALPDREQPPARGVTEEAISQPLTDSRGRRDGASPKAPRALPSEDRPATAGRGGPRHKYLQQLIKHAAADSGYRAEIEQVVEGGRVDVALERDGRRIALEISVGSSSSQEVENVRKCIAAGFHEVIVVCDRRQRLQDLESAVMASTDTEEGARVSVLLPDDVIARLSEEPSPPTTETVVRGYRVKVNHEQIAGSDSQVRREAIAKVILRSMQRLEKPESRP